VRFVLDFGEANAGGAPTFTIYKRLDTLANLTPPAITEITPGHGQYYFDVDFSLVGVDSITFKAELGGIELSDVISGVVPASTTSASASVGSTTGYKTAQYIVNQAALELGLVNGPLSSLGDPFASTDPNIQQLIAFVNHLGDDLNNKHNWTQFVKECTITTAGSATSYALPADFHEIFDQSGWNRSMRLPLVGPLSSQESQFLKARLGNVVINVAFRIEGNMMVFPIAPANGQTIIFEYISSYWVETAASGSGPDADSITNATDFVLYDTGLMIVGAKLLWSESHGKDTTLLQRRFDGKLEHAIGRNVGARVLSMGGSGLSSDRFLDQNNVPPTNFG
jgi:hypothetical protein